MDISHLSRTLVCGDTSEETVMKEISVMPGVSHICGVYCLKDSEAIARQFASEYASLCPFIRCISIADSIASGGFSEEDDIDFNIFVEDGFKYTVYLIGILLSLKYSFKHRKKSLFGGRI